MFRTFPIDRQVYTVDRIVCKRPKHKNPNNTENKNSVSKKCKVIDTLRKGVNIRTSLASIYGLFSHGKYVAI